MFVQSPKSMHYTVLVWYIKSEYAKLDMFGHQHPVLRAQLQYQEIGPMERVNRNVSINFNLSMS